MSITLRIGFALLVILVVSFYFLRVPEQSQLATFTTSLENLSPAQVKNIKVASQSINGVIINSGEVFSFNKHIGPREASRGYYKAPVIGDEKIAYETGGGICQVASTLYNVALLSNFVIVERKPHLWAVSSVSLGRDATVYYPTIDLKFKNPYPCPVRIESEVYKNRLVIRATAPLKVKWKVEIKTVRRDKQKGSCQVDVYRCVINEDGTVTYQLISRDTYK